VDRGADRDRRRGPPPGGGPRPRGVTALMPDRPVRRPLARHRSWTPSGTGTGGTMTARPSAGAPRRERTTT
jgi:hypothetical protein